jgi:hypothetical protein
VLSSCPATQDVDNSRICSPSTHRNQVPVGYVACSPIGIKFFKINVQWLATILWWWEEAFICSYVYRIHVDQLKVMNWTYQILHKLYFRAVHKSMTADSWANNFSNTIQTFSFVGCMQISPQWLIPLCLNRCNRAHIYPIPCMFLVSRLI